MARRGDGVLVLIGAFKLVKAAALVAMGLGAFRLMHHDAAHELHRWVHALRVDPSSHYVDEVIAEANDASPRELEELGIGGLVYAGLFFVEGVGLVLRKLWAEYLTVVITASFIPLEVYELVHRASVAKGVVTALNVAIVLYLAWWLRRDRHWPWRPRGPAGRRVQPA